MNWTIVTTIAIGALLITGAEIAGILRHDEHKTDTITELWHSLRNRLGPWSAALALPLGIVLAWTWWHLSIEGRTTPRNKD